MVPEISHRCPSCGASVRDFGERAMFCPECGKNLTETSSDKPLEEDSQVVTESAVKSDAGEPVVAPPEEVGTVTAAVTEGDAAKPSEVEDRHTARERTRETLHRASTRARGAIEDNVKRVEKIHHVSSVMFEEAHYDPSLRFVLVALALFVVFVILLVLSKVMG
jgi:predicted  nucleic acid-binding Zn-ribbon protein